MTKRKKAVKMFSVSVMDPMQMKILGDQIRQIVREELEELAKHKRSPLYSIQEAAKKLGVSRQSLYRMMKPDENGFIRLHPVRLSKHLKFTQEELDRLTSSSSVSGTIGFRSPVGRRRFLNQAA